MLLLRMVCPFIHKFSNIWKTSKWSLFINWKLSSKFFSNFVFPASIVTHTMFTAIASLIWCFEVEHDVKKMLKSFDFGHNLLVWSDYPLAKFYIIWQHAITRFVWLNVTYHLLPPNRVRNSLNTAKKKPCRRLSRVIHKVINQKYYCYPSWPSCTKNLQGSRSSVLP